ncbi:MAG: transcriptional repressor [Thermoanaerobaculia bacterium]|nr:transcriptional repressor [Thermoanaerobaculia bacterium]
MRPSASGRKRGERELENRRESIQERCRATGLKLTIQRQVVIEALLELPDHPKADEIHAVVAARMPGISRTTTYRTLEQLVRVGVIGKACHPGSASRYDNRTDLHHHLVCMECEAMIDISDTRLDRLPVPDTSGFGFEVHDFRVQLRGLCRRCSAQSRKEDSE